MDVFHEISKFALDHFDFRLDVIASYGKFFLLGALYTVVISLIGIVLCTILGLIVSLGKMFTPKGINFIFVWWIDFFRGTPLLVQIFIVHFGVMHYFMNSVNPVYSAVVALALNHSAYIAEIFRAGIQSIDKGQTEAARSLGMTQAQSMRLIILPQAFKVIIPALGNEFIALLKDSSLAAVIAAPELLYWAKIASAQYAVVWEPYLSVAVLYLVLTMTLSKVVDFIERRLQTE